jgi:hypothetical protein
MLAQEKILEKIIALRVDNDRKAVFLGTLLANLNAVSVCINT